MTWLEILLNAWICDGCQLEVMTQSDGLPEGWVLDITGDLHLCPMCGGQVGFLLARAASA